MKISEVNILQFVSSKPVNEEPGGSVGAATGFGLEGRGSGVRLPAGAWNFSLLHRVQTGCASPSLLSDGCRGLFKRSERETDHSHSSSTEVKNARRYTSTPNTSSCHDSRLIKPRDC
jgi:hypothetical protein